MLSVSKYPKEYIEECKSRLDAHVTAYRSLASAVAKETTRRGSPLDAAIESFEPIFFNNTLLALDGYFAHRSRTLELKDGNPLNEVRVMCNSMMHHDDIMTAEKAIKLSPQSSVLKIQFGERIALSEEDFSVISAAFLAELASKYL